MRNDVEMILIELNQFCNLNCKYCFYNDLGRSDTYINDKKIKEILGKYKNVHTIYLTGGECTLNKDFEKIIKTLDGKVKTILFTNGLLFDDYSKVKLKFIVNKLNKIIITFDSIDSNYNLRINKEDKVINAIKRLVEIDSEKIEIKICLNKMNISSFDDTVLKLLEIGVKHLSINYIKNISSCNVDFELSENEIKDSFDIINKYIKYFNKKDMNFMMDSYKCNFKNKPKCIAGEKFIYIDCFGNEYYCPSSQKKLDNKKDNKCFGKHCVNLWEMF